MATDLNAISRVIRSKNRFVVSAHMHFDGDAGASQLAMARLLRMAGKEAIVVNDEETPIQFRFLPEIETILTAVPADYAPDAVVIIDTPVRENINCGDIRRRFQKPVVSAEEAGTIGKSAWKDVVTIYLDHHERSDPLGEYAYVDPTASAAALIVARLLKALKVPADSTLGTMIVCGIMSDTGRFSFANTTPEALRVVADMMDAGASVNQVATELYYKNSFDSVRVTGQALSTMELSASGKVCSMLIYEEPVNAQGQAIEVEDLPNWPVTIRGVEIGMFLRPGADGTVRVSIRSAGEADVNKFASQFGGGGHKKAAGCKMKIPIEEARRALVAAAEKFLLEK
ncbi:MAG: Bifunctional oligoribonuclease and PAP phosphatase NrnA [Candidatus Latescibacteria bacterium ADurb.Bin168]|nr:MAG: Bifunctional oligoribonuclease and PAP phosphatase NrnA [Candidatus Latescibacteria bacterium ADurb.Bin168]